MGISGILSGYFEEEGKGERGGEPESPRATLPRPFPYTILGRTRAVLSLKR